MLNMILGVVVGLVLGIGAAFFLEYLDTSVKTMEEVEANLGVPVLAVIPRNMNLLPRSRGLDADSEAYRILRTNVEFNRKNPDANTFTVVSGGAGEGKSTTIANLAYTFALGGYNTLIIDADLRRPTMHKIFELENESGLADFLHDQKDLEEVIKHSVAQDNLYIMTSGEQPSDVVAMLSSQRMDQLLNQVKQRFDVIFIDSPPILGVSDASVLASLADLTIIVVQHRRFPKSMLHRVKNAIINVGGNVLGVVLNNVDVRHDQNYEYYTNYYKYYSKPGRRKKAEPKLEGELIASASEDTPTVASHRPEKSGAAKKDFDY
jgi:capsular exopolysaccharide synthesis family protein